MNILRRVTMFVGGLMLLILLTNAHFHRADLPGKEFLYASADGDANQYHIYRAYLDGSHARHVTDIALTSLPFYDVSPDGNWFFVRDKPPRENYDEIYRIRIDGSVRQRLTHNQAWERYWGLSPDGQWIIYEIQDRQGHTQHRVRLDGSRDQVILRGDRQYPELSHDGKWVSYSLNGIPHQARIDGSDEYALTTRTYWNGFMGTAGGRWRYFYTKSADTTYLHRIGASPATLQDVYTIAADAAMIYLDVSPDKRWLVLRFENLDADGTYETYLFADNGAQVGPALPLLSEDLTAAAGTFLWTPDSRWLIAEVYGEKTQPGIYRIRPEDSTGQLISVGIEEPRLLVISPDGRYAVVYTHPTSDHTALFRLDIHSQYPGATPFIILDSNREPWVTGWSSDGEWLYYEPIDRTDRQLYRVNIHTGEVQTLTEGPQKKEFVMWLPNTIDMPGPADGLLVAGVVFALAGLIKRLPIPPSDKQKFTRIFLTP